MSWKEEFKEYTAHGSRFDKVYVKKTLLFKHRLRVVWYANKDTPRVVHYKRFKLDFPWRINDETFEIQYPTLNRIFKFLGIKCPSGETAEYLPMNDIKVKYKKIYRLLSFPKKMWI